MQPKWTEWVQRLQAVAQSGLHYNPHEFDRERYAAVMQIAAEITAAHSDADLDDILAVFDAQTGHATPKIDTRGVVFKNDAILLVRENLDGGRWTLPGGWADPGEPPSVAVTREVREESGFQTRAVKLLALYDRALHDHPPHPFSIYKVFFQCEITGGEAQTSIETSEVAFFAEDKLPVDDLSIGRVTAKQLHRWFEHYRNPNLPTEFD